MAALWTEWPHRARSTNTRVGDWTYTFNVTALGGGLVTGARRGLATTEIDLGTIRAGFRIVPVAAGTGFAVSVLLGNGVSNYVNTSATTTDTIFYLHRFQGRFYFTSGAGTTLANDAVTALAGGTSYGSSPVDYSDQTTLLAGFASADDLIFDYTWEPLSGTSIGADTGQATLNLNLSLDQAFGSTSGAGGDTAYAVLELTPQVVALEDYAPVEVTYVFAPLRLEMAATGQDFSARGTLNLGLTVQGADDALGTNFAVLGMEPMRVFAHASSTGFTTVNFGVNYQFLLNDTATFAVQDAEISEVAQITTTVQADLEVEVGELLSALAESLASYSMRVAEAGAFTDGAVPASVAMVAEQASISDASEASRALSVLISETAIAAALSDVRTPVNVAESALAVDANLAVLVVRVAERAVATGAAQTYYQAIVEISESATAIDAIIRAAAVNVAEQAVAEDNIRALANLFAEIGEAGTVSDGVQTRLILSVNENVTGIASDEAIALGHYFANVFEHGIVSVGFQLGDFGYTGWVMSMDGELPVTEYRNYDFNSFAEMGREVYAANETGLYRLGGDSDAGQPINASIRMLMEDFGTSRQKRVQSAYLGYTTDGELILRVKAVENGQLIEHWFQAVAIPADAPREQRVKLAMGIKSRYWQFELVNVDGADFEIDELELHPLVLSRRV